MPFDTVHQADAGSPLTEEPALEVSPQSSGKPSRWRRQRRWWLLAGVAVLLLGLLPPLVNANRYQRQITRSMSLSLGRPVHLDNVSLHLLPWPGLTLSNFVVSEDPAFGSEPTIRADTVEATLRLSSLWRRRVEFSTVRFVQPSVNLVRNAEGRWNLAQVLLQAAKVNTAPTAQRRAGPAPRFPYIEASGGRVNVKLVEEKLPYSLTEADFALWQPSPHQWRVRLRGQPDRTDADLTDPGLLRVEGDLLQATAGQPVHVDLRANWHDAPLGQASLLLLGTDLGWRGSLNVEASLAGTLEEAAVASKISVGELRRAEFAPALPLDPQVTCAAGLSIATVSVQQLHCTMPEGAAQPVSLTVPLLNLQHPAQAFASLSGTDVPARQGLLWAALFSPRVSTKLEPGTTLASGTLDFQFTRAAEMPEPAGPPMPAPSFSSAKHSLRSPKATSPIASPGPLRTGWQGIVQLHLPVSGEEETGTVATPGSKPAAMTLTLHTVQEDPPAEPGRGGRVLFRLQPSVLQPDISSKFVLSGTVSTGGYGFTVAGTTDKTTLLAPALYVPQLGDNLDVVMPAFHDDSSALPVDFTCSAAWGEPQVCAQAVPAAPVKSRDATAAAAPSSRSR